MSVQEQAGTPTANSQEHGHQKASPPIAARPALRPAACTRPPHRASSHSDPPNQIPPPHHRRLTDARAAAPPRPKLTDPASSPLAPVAAPAPAAAATVPPPWGPALGAQDTSRDTILTPQPPRPSESIVFLLILLRKPVFFRARLLPRPPRHSKLIVSLLI